MRIVDDKFIELLTKELSGGISADELKQLQAFLNEDEVYVTQYKAFKMYWENKDAEYADDAISFQKIKTKILQLENLDQDEATDTQAEDNKRSLFTFWRSVAAILVLCACSYLFYIKYNTLDKAISLNEKVTPKRTRSIIVLSDGTRITLNSGSSLKYPSEFVGKTREVYLIGEAFFNVHKDHQHPFIIHTGKMNVKVLGTEFNVRSYPNETLTETSLIRGSIEVTLSDRPSDHIILKPTEKLIVKNNNLKVEKQNSQNQETGKNNPTTQYTLTSITYLNHADTAVVETSWLNNKLVASSEEFIDLAQKMERWYDVDIIFDNHELEKLRFTATFDKENVKEALDALKRTESFHYRINKSKIYIY